LGSVIDETVLDEKSPCAAVANSSQPFRASIVAQLAQYRDYAQNTSMSEIADYAV
jgi:hypothetical protein